MDFLLVYRQLHRNAVYRTHLIGPDISGYPDINSDLFVIFLKYIYAIHWGYCTHFVLIASSFFQRVFTSSVVSVLYPMGVLPIPLACVYFCMFVLFLVG